MKRNYYNENNPQCVAWIKQLISDGLIPDGEVDSRSITEVQPSDLSGFVQCHFFTGAAGWALALKLAGFPEDKEVWTASCPCQPLSGAGQQKGHEDPRHLWPSFYRLIPKCKPPVILGEQVAGKLGREWLSGIRADLEGTGYAFGGADLCCPCVGEKNPEAERGAAYLRRLVDTGHPSVRGREQIILAAARELDGIISSPPHIRQRLYWGVKYIGLANSAVEPCERKQVVIREGTRKDSEASGNGPVSGLANGKRSTRGTPGRGKGRRTTVEGDGKAVRMADSESGGCGVLGSTQGSTGHASQCDTTQRIADTELSDRRTEHKAHEEPHGLEGSRRGCVGCRVDNSFKPGLEGHAGHEDNRNESGRDGERQVGPAPAASATGGMENPECANGERGQGARTGSSGQSSPGASSEPTRSSHTLWLASEWHMCKDGKARRIPLYSERAFCCMANGVPSGVDGSGFESYGFPLAPSIKGRPHVLRGYGNAINPHVAALFIRSFCEAAKI